MKGPGERGAAGRRPRRRGTHPADPDPDRRAPAFPAPESRRLPAHPEGRPPHAPPAGQAAGTITPTRPVAPGEDIIGKMMAGEEPAPPGSRAGRQWIWSCTVAVSSLSENGLGRKTEFGIRAWVSVKLSSA